MTDPSTHLILIIATKASKIGLLRQIIGKAGYNTEVSTAFDTAVNLALSRQPDLIFLSGPISGSQGFDACRRLKKNDLTRDIPVIFLAETSDTRQKMKAFKAGGTDLIVKPIESHELLSKTGHHIFHRTQNRPPDDKIHPADFTKTQITRLKEALKQTEQKMNAFLEHLPIGILQTTPEGTIIDANPEFMRIMEQTSFDQIAGKRIQDFYYKAKDREKFLKLVSMGPVRNLELRFKNLEGSPIWCSVSSIRQESRQDGVYFISSILDITEKKNSEQEKETLLIQLAQTEKLASIGQLAAGVAHEINNPVGFVKSNINSLDSYLSDIISLIDMTQTILSRLDDEPISSDLLTLKKKTDSFARDIDLGYIIDDISNLMADCKEGMDRIEQIVIDLKEFAHPGKKHPEPVNLNIGMESTLNVIRNELKNKVTVIKDYEDIPPIMGIPQQINQVFMNILANAVQSIDRKGRIWIKTRQADKKVIVTISDDGCGISKAHLNKIFDLFFTTKKVGKGTGLGMNITHNIVLNHCGTIQVRSTEGKGTTVIIAFPESTN